MDWWGLNGWDWISWACCGQNGVAGEVEDAEGMRFIAQDTRIVSFK